MNRTLAPAVLLLPTSALAQQERPELPPEVVVKKVTELEFGELDVSATSGGPNLDLVTGAPAPPPKPPMIPLRLNFDLEMHQSADLVR